MKGARREATSSSPSPHGEGGVTLPACLRARRASERRGARKVSAPHCIPGPLVCLSGSPPSFLVSRICPLRTRPPFIPVHPLSLPFRPAWRSVLVATCSGGNSVNSPLEEGIEVRRVLGGQSAAEGGEGISLVAILQLSSPRVRLLFRVFPISASCFNSPICSFSLQSGFDQGRSIFATMSDRKSTYGGFSSQYSALKSVQSGRRLKSILSNMMA